MPGIRLRQPGFAYSACRPFTKKKKESKNVKKQENHDIFVKKN